MKMSRTCVMLILGVATGPLAHAQTAMLAPGQAPSPAVAKPSMITIKFRPADQPRSALKYRLVPERLTLVPGNATVFYHRAIQMTIEKRRLLAEQAKEKLEQSKEKPDPKPRVLSTEEQINQWNSMPIADIPVDKAREMLRAFEQPLKEVELGAKRATCDWEFDSRTDGFFLLLPEIQEMRSLARLVTLQSRLLILDGKIDEAMHWIETGLVMGRHVSQGTTLIQALVGVAIDSIMIRSLEELIQAPGTPSLYWALADRPRPFIDLRQALEGERSLLEKEIPGLLELDRGLWSVEHANKFVDELQTKLFALVSGEPIPGTNGAIPAATPAIARKLGIAAMTSKIYPEARQALIAQGRPEREIDAMPTIQVAALYSYLEYKRMEDESYKWMNVPYWQSVKQPDLSFMQTVDQKLANPLFTMFRMISPALNSVRVASLRIDRQLDALQCVEAIRLYAAVHGGQWPATLEAITEAPAPLDLMTGKPFDYKVDGDTATLSAPVPPGAPNHPTFAIRYALKLTK